MTMKIMNVGKITINTQMNMTKGLLIDQKK